MKKSLFALLIGGFLLFISNIALASPFDGAWQVKVEMNGQTIPQFLLCESNEKGPLCTMLRYDKNWWWGYTLPQLEGNDKLVGTLYDILTPGWHCDFSVALTSSDVFGGIITCFDPEVGSSTGTINGQKIW